MNKLWSIQKHNNMLEEAPLRNIYKSQRFFLLVKFLSVDSFVVDTTAGIVKLLI